VNLVEAVLDGNREAFAAIVDEYEKPLFNVAYRITGSWDDALEATQSTFVKAYENLHRFDRRRRFFSWIYRIAINEALDLVRSRRAVELPDDLTEPAPGPEDRLSADETCRRVQRAILQLGEHHRVVIVLRHFLGMSYEEMGEAVGIPAKTVKSRLFTARQRLRELLDDGTGGET
jgi:RNA polymerase sigma-70 factor, ECF subfamily